jgi:ankyrin repeat protein
MGMDIEIAFRHTRALRSLVYCLFILAVASQAFPARAQTAKSANDDLFNAAMMGDLEGVKGLLDNGANIEYVQPGSKQTVLQAAVGGVSGMYTGAHVKVVKLLLDRGAKLGLHDGALGTALFTAVRANGVTSQTAEQIEVVRMLLDHKASVGALGPIRDTPLHAAAECLHLESARLLIEHGADVNAVDSGGVTPLAVVRSIQWDIPEDKKGGPEDVKQAMIDLLRKAGAK